MVEEDFESRHRSLLLGLQAGVVAIERASGAVKLDEVARSLLGTDRPELSRDALIELIDVEYRSETIDELSLAAEEDPPRDVYLPIAGRGGTRWLRLRCETEGRPVRAPLRSGTLLDVTLHEHDRRALARQLRHNETFARLAARLLQASSVDACVEAIREEAAPPLSLDFSSVELFADGDESLRAETERLADEHGPVAYFPDLRAVDGPKLRHATSEPRLRTFITAPIMIDGALVGAMSVGSLETPRHLVDDDIAFFGSVVALAAGAIGAQRLAESHRQMEEKLARSQKMESLGMLAGGIAHDFNNLLVGILGNASLALSSLPDDAPGRTELRNLRLAALRASDLTKQLLAYAGRAQFEVSRVDVRQVVEEMGSLLRAAIPKNVEMSYELSSEKALVLADVTQLRQVLMNLLTNASDAIGRSEGRITVSVRRADVPAWYFADALFGEAKAGATYVVITISDTGVGMSPEVRARIFDPFFTTKSSGRGLGLAAVLGILRAHQGTIKVQSELGKGTSIEILLPALTETPLDRAEPRRDTPGTLRIGSGTVLVIDDEPLVRAVAKRSLERAGFDVIIAEDGLAGVSTFAANVGKVVAVLLDSSMPRLGGLEALARIRALDPNVPVVLSSGYADQDFAAAAEHDGVKFLAKPFDPRQLVAAVVAAVEPPPSSSRPR